MEELHTVTLQYINCGDPVESEARKRRVQQTDEMGLTEETARSIIDTATQAHNLAVQQTLAMQELEAPLVTSFPPNQQPATIITRKRGRPAKQKDLRISPKTFTGSSSQKRNLLAAQASPTTATGNNQRKKAPGTSNRAPKPARGPQQTAPLPPLPPPTSGSMAASTSTGEPVDFHRGDHPLP